MAKIATNSTNIQWNSWGFLHNKLNKLNFYIKAGVCYFYNFLQIIDKLTHTAMKKKTLKFG